MVEQSETILERNLNEINKFGAENYYQERNQCLQKQCFHLR